MRSVDDDRRLKSQFQDAGVMLNANRISLVKALLNEKGEISIDTVIGDANMVLVQFVSAIKSLSIEQGIPILAGSRCVSQGTMGSSSLL